MENEQITAEKAALIATTATPGWRVVMRIAGEMVAEMTTEALNCDDDTKALRLLTKAQAAKDFFTRFSQRIENHKLLNVEDGNNDFMQLTY